MLFHVIRQIVRLRKNIVVPLSEFYKKKKRKQKKKELERQQVLQAKKKKKMWQRWLMCLV